MSINSLGFAGMFLVKSEEEAEAVVKEGIVNMLRLVVLLSFLEFLLLFFLFFYSPPIVRALVGGVV